MQLSMSEFVFYGVMMTVLAGVVVGLQQLAPDLHPVLRLIIGGCVAGPIGYGAQQMYERSNAPGRDAGGFDDDDQSRRNLF